MPPLRITKYVSHFKNERSHRYLLINLLLIAFILRLAIALIIPLEYRLQGDAVEYVSDARHLLTLGVFGEQPGIPYAIIPPGYPLFIAAIFAPTNQSLLAVRLVQVLLSALMVWLTYLIGQQLTSRSTGLLAASICAFYPVFIIWPTLFLIETFYTALLLLFIWCLIRSIKTPTAKYVLLAGTTFGLTLLTREVLILSPFFLPFILWRSGIAWQNVWCYLLVFTISTLLVLSPWFIRNYDTFGQIFYTERIEYIRYQLTGSGYLSPYYQSLVDGSRPPRPEKYPGYFARYGRSGQVTSLNFALTNPTTYLRIILNRIIEVWFHPNGLESLPSNLLLQGMYIALHVAMLGLASVGLLMGLKNGKVGVLVFTLLLLYVTSTFIFFSAPNPRYTMPFLPLIFILAAMGVESIWSFSQRVGKTGTC